MLCERALWKTKLLKKSPFTLINCIKLFIFPSRSGLVERTMEEKERNQVERVRGGDAV